MANISNNRWKIAVGYALLLTLVTDIYADIKEDQTLASPTTVKPIANGFEVEGGTRRNANIYHSFREFSLSTNQEVVFSHPDSDGILNIISRVTGGNASDIDGTIDTSSFKNANFFLLNPAGIIFGKKAKLNTNGSFHATTADYILFPGGKSFYVQNNDSELSVAPPSAFGFIGNDAQAITSSGNLLVKEGKIFSFVGGDIEVLSGEITAPNGDVFLISRTDSDQETPVPDLGEIFIGGEYQDTGTIFILNGSAILGKNIFTKSEDIFISGNSALIVEILNGKNSSAMIDLNATNLIELSGGAFVQGYGEVEKNNLVINLTANEVTLDELGRIELLGDINKNSVILGEVLIKADDLVRVINGGNIISDSGGDIRIEVTRGKLIVSGNNDNGALSKISTSISSGSSPGNISLESEVIELKNNGLVSATSSVGSDIQSGDITLKADELHILSGGRVLNTVAGRSFGGKIAISTEELLNIDDSGTTQSTGISSSTAGKGSAGILDIKISDGVLVVRGGRAKISSDSLNNMGDIKTSDGDAGAIYINKNEQGRGNIVVDFAGIISTKTETPGLGGIIQINAKSMSVLNGGIVSVESSGVGDAGSITIITTEELRLNSGKLQLATELSNAGNINIGSDSLVYIENFSSVETAVSNGSGLGGDININDSIGNNAVVFKGSSTIRADAKEGQAGNIVVNARELFAQPEERVNNITASADKELNEGEIKVNTAVVDATSGVVELPATFFDVTNLIASRCTSQSEGQSSFYVGGRRGLGTSPDLLLAGYLDDDGNARLARGSGQSVVSTNANFTGLSTKIVCSR